MYNLLSNAIKFTPAYGAVTVSARVLREAVEWWGRDDREWL